MIQIANKLAYHYYYSVARKLASRHVSWVCSSSPLPSWLPLTSAAAVSNSSLRLATSWCSSSTATSMSRLRVSFNFGSDIFAIGGNRSIFDRNTVRNNHTNSTGVSLSTRRIHRLDLPFFGQNGTLNINSSSLAIDSVQVISQWREDASLELIELDGIIPSRLESEIETLHEVERDYDTEIKTIPDEITYLRLNGMQVKFSPDGITTSLGRKGSLLEIDLDSSESNGVENLHSISSKKLYKLVAVLPEKCNLRCNLQNGNITISGKIEGDAHLSTGGNITAGKMRGHEITLEAIQATVANSAGVIHIQKAAEARSLKIISRSRVRARMVNGSNVMVRVDSNRDNYVPETLDEDDSGARIDIGSLYVSSGGGEGHENEAQLVVNETRNSGQEGLVRVKSSHGHVRIHATTPITSANARNTDQHHDVGHESNQCLQPLVDLGGVNGSCDVTLYGIHGDDAQCPGSKDSLDSTAESTAVRIHFDSLAPESISTVTSRGTIGGVGLTLDRKLEADVRLLSFLPSPNIPSYLPKGASAHNLTSSHLPKGSRIVVDTDAFEEDPDLHKHALPFQYTQGKLRNCSGEPDSRFDVRTRGGGKIDIEGAKLQALHGFTSQMPKGNLPLLAVATDGSIRLETLSWIGSIARRYGLKEDGARDTVGRQASRAPRLT